MKYVLSLLCALLLTEAIELPVARLCGVKGRDLLFVVLANVMTNPAVNVLYAAATVFTKLPMVAVLAALEIAAVVAEWIVYRYATGAKRPFLVSLVCNAASFGAGLLLNLLY